MSRPPKPATPDQSPLAQPDHPSRSEALLWRFNKVVDSTGMSRRTIERLRSAGRFPKPDLKIGKAPLWKPETIRRWIDEGGFK
jgi:predicted DNA-binding transcriptional regulator AlpA